MQALFDLKNLVAPKTRNVKIITDSSNKKKYRKKEEEMNKKYYYEGM